MKKVFINCFVLFFIMTSLIFISCADVNGLHNQQAANVTFRFVNFGDDIEGNFAIPGNFDNWDNTTVDVSLTKGRGTSVKIPVTESNIQFTLVPTGSWNRPWYSKGLLEGNGSDSGKMRNFYIDGLDLDSGDITVLIDASSGIAVPKVN